ncbi:MAG: DUF1638 domain-containing protein [Aggregatilineales bacterium]
MKRYLALTCTALARSVYAAAATSPHAVTVTLLEQGLHNRPKNLRAILQERIDSPATNAYDAVLLAYGLCGAATAGLVARSAPLVLPRAHDCITLYLGSRQRYLAEFEKHPGTYWYSVDYMERQDPANSVALGAAGIEASEAEYETYVAKFGEETAAMLMDELRRWSQHYTRAAFIDTGLGDPEPYAAQAREKAEREGWVFERMAGDCRLMNMLISGEWPEDEFLVVPPGYRVEQAADDRIIRAVPAG